MRVSDLEANNARLVTENTVLRRGTLYACGKHRVASPVGVELDELVQAAVVGRPREATGELAFYRCWSPQPVAMQHLVAATALARCTRRGSGAPMDVLTAMLDDPQSRAATVLRECGVDLDEIRQMLRTGHAPRPSPLPTWVRTSCPPRHRPPRHALAEGRR